MTLPTGELKFTPVTLHLDSEPQQFTKQTVPTWERVPAAASDAMNTINTPCYSFPALLAIKGIRPTFQIRFPYSAYKACSL